MPTSMGEASDVECGGDEEVMNNGGRIRSREERGDDECESNSDSDPTAGLDGSEEGRLSSRVEVVGGRYPTEYNYIGSSSEAGLPKKRCEDGDFANLGADTKDTELRLGLPEVSGSRGRNPGQRLFDRDARNKQNLSRNEPNTLLPRCSLDSQGRAFSIQGQEYARMEEFKLKPMFREFTTLDLPFDVRFSHARPPLEINNARASSSGVKRIFSESGRASASGEPKPPPALGSQRYLPPPLPASMFNFPFAGGPTPRRLKWEPQQLQSRTSYGQYPGHMGPNEVKRNEATLPMKSPHADQKASPVESQPSRIQTGTCSEQRAAPAVGWPPVRSFRRNLASQPKLAPAPTAEPPPVFEKKLTTMFVKVNVEGLPIGRKIDLKAYDSYDKLALALDDMFRNPIAVKNPGSSSGSGDPLRGGEYELVYEDEEGDRMLVGDVPWGMFVAAVKRLRIIRSSEARGPVAAEREAKAEVDR